MTNLPEDPAPSVFKPTGGSARTELFQRHRWLPFVLPFAVFSLSGLLEQLPLSYPLVYTLRVVLTGLAVLFVWPSWKAISWRCSWLAVAIGVVGGVLWVVICRFKLEDQLLTLVGLEAWTTMGDRPQFDPYAALGATPWVMVAFLTVRLAGLTVIVPLIEELFVRGFLMRFIEKPDWWTIELGSVGRKAAITATVYGVLAHPAEPLAAALWFSLITLLYARTRSIGDCVVAHAVTNGLMGLYILIYRDWTLW